MVRLTASAAVWVLLAAAVARAQVTGVVTSRTVSVEDLFDNIFVAGPVADSAMQYSFPNGTSPYFQAIENYQVSADVTSSEIDFANNATSQGFFSATSTTTQVDVTYQNGGSATVRPTLRSTILPGGFGFYMDAPQANPTLSGSSIGDVNQTPQSTAGAVIRDPYFPVFQLGLPTFNSGTGVLNGPPILSVQPSLPLQGVTPAPFQSIPGYVLSATPEPETWTLMLVGLGLVGLAMRRRSSGPVTDGRRT